MALQLSKIGGTVKADTFGTSKGCVGCDAGLIGWGNVCFLEDPHLEVSLFVERLSSFGNHFLILSFVGKSKIPLSGCPLVEVVPLYTMIL